MTIEISVQQKVKHYILAYLQCSEAWNLEEMGINPGIIIMNLKEEILTSLGLPPSAYQYISIMEQYAFANEDIKQRADDLYERLCNEAILYLSSPPIPDTQILKNGKTKGWDAREVLPFIGLPITAYSRFLLHNIYYIDKCDEEELLNALRIEVIGNGNFNFGEHSSFASEFKFYLSQKNKLKYLPIIKQSKIFEQNHPENRDVIFHNFYITHFTVHNSMMCTVNILHKHQESLLMLQIWCTLRQLEYMLSYSLYTSDSTPILMYLRYHNFDKGGYTFNCKEQKDIFIEITNIDMRVGRLDCDHNTIRFPYDFVIVSLAQSSPQQV